MTQEHLTQKQAYDLYLEGLSYHQIAEDYDTTAEAVRSKIRRYKATVPAAKGNERVLVIADTHCPAMHHGYIDFLISIFHKHKCTRVVHIGDLVDWNAISFHEKDPSMPSAADEFVAASKQVRALHKAFPEVDYLIGNHSALPERKAQSVGLPPEVILNFKTLWGLDGWEIHPRFTDLLIDNVIYRHGDKEKGGQMSALKNAQAQFKSLVMGHLHAQAGINYHANQDGVVFGMNVGCGVDHSHPAMNYGRIYAARPVLGCGVVYSPKLAFFEPMFI
jgi:predicted phosphodiesterase